MPVISSEWEGRKIWFGEARPTPKMFSYLSTFLGILSKLLLLVPKRNWNNLYSAIFKGVLWSPSYINSPWCGVMATIHLRFLYFSQYNIQYNEREKR